MSWTDDALWQIRLNARHGTRPLTRELIAMYLEDGLTEAQVRGAHAQGEADKAAGVKCLCRLCEIDRTRIVSHEKLRQAYEAKRRQDLAAAGVADKDISRRIDDEIRAGAALRGETHA